MANKTISPPPKTIADGDAVEASVFTEAGLPVDPTRLGTVLAAVDVGDGGPARRVDCRPPPLLSAPPVQAFKAPLPGVLRATGSLVVGPAHGSLIDDDDDDELMDYFGSSSGTFVPATDNNVVPPSAPWDVRDHNVRTLPLFYPLENSAVLVPQASAPVLASRIAAVLGTRAIAASYDSKNAKVDCVSKAHVEFRIRLYRGRGDYSHGIIVEVQRRAGLDPSYIQDAYAILDAAEGKTIEDCAGGVAPLYYEEGKGIEDMDILDNAGGIACLQIISDILTPKIDKAQEATVEARDLAMASLAAMTNLERMGQTAVTLSKVFITSKTHADLRGVVFSHISQDPNQTSQRLMNMSLEILANVATCSHCPSQLVDVLSQNDNVIMRNLFVNIENAPINPHAADLSRLILQNI